MNLCGNNEVSNQILDSRNYYYGKRQCRKYGLIANTGNVIEDEYFQIGVISEDYTTKTVYTFWYNGGTGAQPVVAGTDVYVEITVVAEDDLGTVTGKTESAILGAITEGIRFSTNLTTGEIEIQNSFLGAVEVEVASSALTITVEEIGVGGFLGAIADGGASMSTEQEFIDVVADQTGGVILDKLIRSLSANIELPLVEMTKQNWKLLIGTGVGSIVDTDNVGYGTANVYQSAFAKGGMLVSHPVRLPESDRSADITMWKTFPVLSEITFSGSDVQQATVSFDGLRDASKEKEYDIFYYGDHAEK